MRVAKHDITFHYEFEKATVKNIDPDRYSFLDLMDHVFESSPIHPGSVLSFHDGKGFPIENDKDLLRMFDRHKFERDILISILKVGSPLAIIEAEIENVVVNESSNEVEVECENENANEVEADNENADEVEAENENENANGVEAENENVVDIDPPEVVPIERQPKNKEIKKKGKRVRSKPYTKGKTKDCYSFRTINRNEDDVVLSDEELDESDDEYSIGVEGDDVNMDESDGDNTAVSAEDSFDGSESDGDWSACQSEDEDADLDDSDVDIVDILKGREKVFKGLIDETFEWREGMIFKDVKHIRDVFRDYIVKGAYELARIQNDKVRLMVVCAIGDYQWRLNASRL